MERNCEWSLKIKITKNKKYNKNEWPWHTGDTEKLVFHSGVTFQFYRFYRFDYIKIPISFVVAISFLLCFEWSQMKYHVYEQRKTYNEHKNKQQQQKHLLFFLVWGTGDGHWVTLRTWRTAACWRTTGFACVCMGIVEIIMNAPCSATHRRHRFCFWKGVVLKM